MQSWGGHCIHEAIGELIGPGLIVKVLYHSPFPQTCRDRFKRF